MRAAAAYRAFRQTIHHDIGNGTIPQVNAGVLHRHPQITIQHAAGLRRDLIAEGAVDEILKRFQPERKTGLEHIHARARQIGK